MSSVIIRDRSDVVQLLASTPVPEGWRIEVQETRRYRHRSQWAVFLFHGNEQVTGVSTYDPAERVRRFAANAWAEASRAS